jgi:hypothetical protein
MSEGMGAARIPHLAGRGCRTTSHERYGPAVDSSWIKVGAVFRWVHDERPARILVHDGATVMYDAWWPHLDAWGLADLDKARRVAVSYYVTPTSTLLAKADFLRYEPLTTDEESLHRPDLPFAVVRRPGASWPAVEPDVTAFAAAFGTNPFLLTVPEVYLCAFGPSGGSKRAVRISAEDKVRFTASELMRKAAELQMPNLGNRLTVDGVGVYRQGLHRGRPCFYLWGTASRGETHLAEFEHSRADSCSDTAHD